MSVPSYWREMPQRYRLEAARCLNCGKISFPPRKICPSCKERSFETVQLEREGKLLTFTIIRVAPSVFTDQVPYAIGIVELKQNVRILCQIVDCRLDEIKSGMPVSIEFRRVSEDGEAGVIHYGYKAVPKDH
ncbi:MAG TPA: Zn-ribbon domain-containing OB-fold protein [Caldithrix abyssi]|uniref:Zn-ribbon domain-containing OB-fold protein n=1 Tax=Caldithrix abyssi TaxID=187145 RepID=A0A7V4UDN3_CALAY|nr:Zn-ribbon domain-containing OB-fold protein [Caldithrix abyssi]